MSKNYKFYTDFDYFHKLSAEEKTWLRDFIAEYYFEQYKGLGAGSVGRDAVRRDIFTRNVACAYAAARDRYLRT
jgi:hypothetical protein